MERPNADVRAVETSLEQAPEVLDAVGVNLPVHVLDGVVDGAMVEVSTETGVRRQRVGVDGRSGFDAIPDVALESAALDAVNDVDADPAAALNHADDGGLVVHRATPSGLMPVGLVHVAGLAADVGLVNFNLTREHGEALRLHRKPDALEHEPRRLLSDPEGSSEFVRADPVLGVRSKPNGREPLVQSEGRVLEDRAELDAELLLTRLALPKAASREVGSTASKPYPDGASPLLRATGQRIGQQARWGVG